MIRFSSVAFPLALFALVVSSVGCVHVKPWQRGKLAHPTMVAGSANGPGEEHMYGVHEGASGGSDGAGSGCGCN
ncbi:MAG: DUF4266 domain-containing protein [Polyangiaceae bacterium]